MRLTDGKLQIIHLAIMVAVALFFWNTVFIYPVKLFVVMLHEMSHGLMATAFGGTIIEIQIDRLIGGYCKFEMEPTFWALFMTGSAGYLGSLFWGALILVLASKSSKDKYITLAIAITLLGLSYFVFQSGELFGTAAIAGLAIFMLVSFKFFGPFFNDLWLKFIGIISCIYVILDIKDDLIDRTNIGSDADKIAELTGIPSITVGIAWICIASLTLFFVLRYVYRQEKIEF